MNLRSAKQKARAVFIGKLTAEGVYTKIEDRGDGLVRVWTSPAFDDLRFQTKQAFCNVIYAYHFDGTRDSDFIVLHDGRSGKEIGRLHRWGLTMR